LLSCLTDSGSAKVDTCHPESERRSSDVFPDIDPSFLLTCENISILRVLPKESMTGALTTERMQHCNFRCSANSGSDKGAGTNHFFAPEVGRIKAAVYAGTAQT